MLVASMEYMLAVGMAEKTVETMVVWRELMMAVLWEKKMAV